MQSQRSLKASHDALMAKVEEQSSQLKEERLRSLGLEKQLQSGSLAQRRVDEVREDRDTPQPHVTHLKPSQTWSTSQSSSLACTLLLTSRLCSLPFTIQAPERKPEDT